MYEAELGILRVPHVDAEDARGALEAEGGLPITTSGTILAAKKRAGGIGS